MAATPAASPRPAPRPIAWMDGRVVPASEATVPLLDDGFLRGDAVFDSVLVRGGRTHALAGHLARLRRSGQTMGIRIPVLRQVVGDLLAAWGPHDGALKLVVTRGGALRGVLAGITHPDSFALHLVDVPWRTAVSGVKTLSYAANQWALREAQRNHADDALIVDDGQVLELPTGSICVVTGGEVVTPDPARLPILDSVTVAELQHVTPVRRGLVTPEQLATADEVFIVSATRPIVPVHAIDDDEYPSPGPRTAELQAGLEAHIAATLDDQP